jgi:hypothetical protein
MTGGVIAGGGVGEGRGIGPSTATSRYKFADRFDYNSDFAATKYKANKYDPKTGLGGYVAPHVYNIKDDSNIMVQLQKNIKPNRASPLEFKDGSTLEIRPSAAIAALNRIASMKAVEKHETVKNLVLSKDNFISFLNDVDQLEEGLDGGPLDTNSMMYDSHFAAHYEKQPPDVQSSLDTYLKAGLSYPDAVYKVENGPSAAKYRITPLKAGPLLGRGMSSDARARDIDRSDIEYIEQREFKDQWKQENPGKKWPGYDEAGFKSRYGYKER